MPRRKQVDTLKSKCIGSICKNMDSFWYKNYWEDSFSCPERVMFENGPFEYLPGSLLNEIAERLKKYGSVGDNIITSLITATSVNLAIPRSNRGPLVFDLISLKCEVTLKGLKLSGCTFENKDLIKAVKSLRNLEVLNLDQTEIDDEVLCAVGSHCCKLRVLSLYRCKYITEKSMEYLFVPESSVDGVNSYGKCKLIERLNISFTEVGASGIETVLRNAPKLQNLDHSNVILALVRMHCNDLESNSTFYSLTTLKSEFYEENLFPSKSFAHALSIVSRVCPYVTEVVLAIDCDIEKGVFRSLCRLNNLKKLEIECYDCEQPDLIFSEIVPVLSVSGQSITRLHLKELPWVDVGLIGVCCPLLEDFSLEILDVAESRKEVFIPPATNRKSFSFLKLLIVYLGYSDYDTWEGFDITPSQWKQMLSSSLLESLEIQGSSTLTDGILSEVLNCGQEFPNLKKITLSQCPNITSEFVWSILNLTNPLEELYVGSCKKISSSVFDLIESFCMDDGFDVHTQFYTPSGV